MPKIPPGRLARGCSAPIRTSDLACFRASERPLDGRRAPVAQPDRLQTLPLHASVEVQLCREDLGVRPFRGHHASARQVILATWKHRNRGEEKASKGAHHPKKNRFERMND